MWAVSQGQQRARQKKFSSPASTLGRKTCRLSSRLHAKQRELCSNSVASTALQASTSGLISATPPSSLVSSTEEILIGEKGRRTGKWIRQNFLWSWTQLAAADWKSVWKSSTFTATRLCLHPKCRRSWTRRTCRTFLWSMSGHSNFHRKWRMSSSS